LGFGRTRVEKFLGKEGVESSSNGRRREVKCGGEGGESDHCRPTLCERSEASRLLWNDLRQYFVHFCFRHGKIETSELENPTVDQLSRSCPARPRSAGEEKPNWCPVDQQAHEEVGGMRLDRVVIVIDDKYGVFWPVLKVFCKETREDWNIKLPYIASAKVRSQGVARPWNDCCGGAR
jgi:hypothetical protein